MTYYNSFDQEKRQQQEFKNSTSMMKQIHKNYSHSHSNRSRYRSYQKNFQYPNRRHSRSRDRWDNYSKKYQKNNDKKYDSRYRENGKYRQDEKYRENGRHRQDNRYHQNNQRYRQHDRSRQNQRECKDRKYQMNRVYNRQENERKIASYNHSRAGLARDRQRINKFGRPISKRSYSYSQSSSQSSSRSSGSYSRSSSSNSSGSCSQISQNQISHHQSNSSFKVSSSGSTARRRKAPHFRFRVGQRIGHQYKISSLLGDGTFGRVLQGKYRQKLYAIKVQFLIYMFYQVIKPVQKYIKSAKIQKTIVKQINSRDPKDEFGIVRYIQSFYHYNHYCIVFEQLGKSLYNVIKKNQYQGFSLKLVKSFFRQILQSLSFIHQLGYTHTDLKPQNILLVESELTRQERYYEGKQKTYYQPVSDRIKIIDFGSATKYDDHHSSIINTRQYRSPQVLLQCCKWNQLSDVWSVGCIIVELFTGDLLFQTHQDHEHIAMIEKNSGTFPRWMIEDCSNSLKKSFDKESCNLKQSEILRYAPQQGANIIYMKTVIQIFQTEPLLANLLEKCLQIDPKKRLSCKEALAHPYFVDYKQKLI